MKKSSREHTKVVGNNCYSPKNNLRVSEGIKSEKVETTDSVILKNSVSRAITKENNDV